MKAKKSETPHDDTDAKQPAPAKAPLGSPRIAASIASAASLWGIDKSELQRAKRNGCTAFRSSRVHREPLLAWFEANPAGAAGEQESEESLKRDKLRAQVAILRNKLDVENGTLVLRSVVSEEWGKLLADVFGIIDKNTDRTTYNAITKELKHRLRGV